MMASNVEERGCDNDIFARENRAETGDAAVMLPKLESGKVGAWLIPPGMYDDDEDETDDNDEKQTSNDAHLTGGRTTVTVRSVVANDVVIKSTSEQPQAEEQRFSSKKWSEESSYHDREIQNYGRRETEDEEARRSSFGHGGEDGHHRGYRESSHRHKNRRQSRSPSSESRQRQQGSRDETSGRRKRQRSYDSGSRERSVEQKNDRRDKEKKRSKDEESLNKTGETEPTDTALASGFNGERGLVELCLVSGSERSEHNKEQSELRVDKCNVSAERTSFWDAEQNLSKYLRDDDEEVDRTRRSCGRSNSLEKGKEAGSRSLYREQRHHRNRSRSKGDYDRYRKRGHRSRSRDRDKFSRKRSGSSSKVYDAEGKQVVKERGRQRSKSQELEDAPWPNSANDTHKKFRGEIRSRNGRRSRSSSISKQQLCGDRILRDPDGHKDQEPERNRDYPKEQEIRRGVDSQRDQQKNPDVPKYMENQRDRDYQKDRDIHSDRYVQRRDRTKGWLDSERPIAKEEYSRKRRSRSAERFRSASTLPKKKKVPTATLR